MPTPYFTDSLTPSAKDGHARAEQEDHPFYTFRLNGDAVVSLDWPNGMKEDDAYMRLARDTFHSDVCPTIGELLTFWKAPVQGEVGLRQFSVATGAKTSVQLEAHAEAPPPTAQR